MIKDITLHYQTPSAIKAFQEERLCEALAYLQEHSAFYRRMFESNNIDINTIKSIEDLTRIPTTSKQDLQSYNADFLCVDPVDIIDYVTTSGTLGEPVTFALTESDLQRLAYNEASSFTMA
jgi:phenylacetate-CoA ligase